MPSSLNKFLARFSLLASCAFMMQQTFSWPTPYDPRLSAWGTGGDHTLGQGDFMLPLAGNESFFWYGDVQGKYGSDENSTGSFGTGLRGIFKSDYLLGAYLFADYNHFDNGGNFWFLSPGAELMGLRWDLHLNGYFPISSQTQFVGQDFGDNLGIANDVSFGPHEQYDDLFSIFNSVGPGIDAELGYQWFKHYGFKTYVGGYHFSPKIGDNINGGSLKLLFPINHHFSLLAEDNYDNTFHNSFMAGVRLTFGGEKRDILPQTLQDRMLDPIERNLATISNGNSVPEVTSLQDQGNRVLERSNIYFFTNNGGSNFDSATGSANCTFANPCNAASFTQTNINAINSFAPSTNFYFNGGTYQANGSIFDNSPGAATSLSINNGQSFYGRSSDYKLAASGNGRPSFIGGLNLAGNNTIDSVQVLNNAADRLVQGIKLVDANNVVINNSVIGALNSEQGYAEGILVQNSNLTLNNSVVNAYTGITGAPSDATIGIQMDGLENNLTMNNSRINIAGDAANSVSIGIWLTPFSGFPVSDSIVLNNSEVNINTSNAGVINGISAGVSGTANITLNNSEINTNIINGVSGNANSGIVDLMEGNLNLNHSNISATTTNQSSNINVTVRAIEAGNPSSGAQNIVLDHSTISANATTGPNSSAEALGLSFLFLSPTTTTNLTVNDSVISAVANAANDARANDIFIDTSFGGTVGLTINNSILRTSATGSGTIDDGEIVYFP